MKEKGLRVLTNLLAFAVLIFIAVSLVVGKISGEASELASVCGQTAKISAFVLVGLASFWYAMSKRSLIIKCLWLASVIVVVVMLIL